MSMEKRYPGRLNIPCTQEMADFVREQSGGDGKMAHFSRELLEKAIADYKIHNPQVKPDELIIDTEEKE